MGNEGHVHIHGCDGILLILAYGFTWGDRLVGVFIGGVYGDAHIYVGLATIIWIR